MKRIGIIGGIGPESTVDYYKLIIGAHVPIETPRSKLRGLRSLFRFKHEGSYRGCKWI